MGLQAAQGATTTTARGCILSQRARIDEISCDNSECAKSIVFTIENGTPGCPRGYNNNG